MVHFSSCVVIHCISMMSPSLKSCKTTIPQTKHQISTAKARYLYPQVCNIFTPPLSSKAPMMLLLAPMYMYLQKYFKSLCIMGPHPPPSQKNIPWQPNKKTEKVVYRNVTITCIMMPIPNLPIPNLIQFLL